MNGVEGPAVSALQQGAESVEVRRGKSGAAGLARDAGSGGIDVLMTIPRAVLAISITFTLLLSACAAMPDAHDVAACRQVLEVQTAAWNRGDIDGFVDGYLRSPELVFAGADSLEVGFEAMVERYRRRYPDAAAMGHLTFGALEFRALGADTMLVSGAWGLEREAGPLGGQYALVMRKVGVGWRIVLDYTTSVP